MPSISYGVSAGSISEAVIIEGDDPIGVEVTLLAGKPVTAWVKTDANTAACNFASGHGQTDGLFDVYWSGGYRYGVTGTITTNALALDGGSGTDFPASATEDIVVCKQQIINKAIDGDNVKFIAFEAKLASATGYGSRLTFFDATAGGGSAVGSGLLLEANVPQAYHIAAGVANPLTGSPILSLVASNGDSTYDAVLKIQGVQDVTP